MEKIFDRCLRTSTSVQLWAFYITFIRRRNPVDGVDVDKAKTSRILINQSYDFCLGHVGQDRQAGPLWYEYIGFLKGAPVRCNSLRAAYRLLTKPFQSSGTWEAQQNMDNIRRTYQQAVAIPLDNVEQIWSEYNHWEQQLNKLTVRCHLLTNSIGPGQDHYLFVCLPCPRLGKRPHYACVTTLFVGL